MSSSLARIPAAFVGERRAFHFGNRRKEVQVDEQSRQESAAAVTAPCGSRQVRRSGDRRLLDLEAVPPVEGDRPRVRLVHHTATPAGRRARLRGARRRDRCRASRCGSRAGRARAGAGGAGLRRRSRPGDADEAGRERRRLGRRRAHRAARLPSAPPARRAHPVRPCASRPTRASRSTCARPSRPAPPARPARAARSARSAPRRRCARRAPAIPARAARATALAQAGRGDGVEDAPRHLPRRCRATNRGARRRSRRRRRGSGCGGSTRPCRPSLGRPPAGEPGPHSPHPLASRAPAHQSNATRRVPGFGSGPRRAGARLTASGSRAAPGQRKRSSRSELSTTNTELNAIAAPAIIGESIPSAASGIASTL